MGNWYDMIMIDISVDMDGFGHFEFCCKKLALLFMSYYL